MDISLIYILDLLLITPVLGLMGYFIRKAFTKLDAALTEDQVRRLIEDKLESLRAEQRAIEDRVRSVERKLDKIIDILTDDRIKSTRQR